MKQQRCRGAAIFLLILSSVSTTTRGELIVNGGFEDPFVPSDSVPGVVYHPGDMIGAGWLVLGDLGTNLHLGRVGYNEPNHPVVFNIFEGRNALDLSGNYDQGPSVGIQQSVATRAGFAYDLSFHVGRAMMVGGPAWPYESATTVYLSINGGPRIAFTNSDSTEGYINWKRFNHSFVATGDSTTIAFFNGSDGDNDGIFFDAVSMTSVPEPSSAILAILAAGALMIPAARRR